MRMRMRVCTGNHSRTSTYALFARDRRSISYNMHSPTVAVAADSPQHKATMQQDKDKATIQEFKKLRPYAVLDYDE